MSSVYSLYDIVASRNVKHNKNPRELKKNQENPPEPDLMNGNSPPITPQLPFNTKLHHNCSIIDSDR
jgi:hypothetical protein